MILFIPRNRQPPRFRYLSYTARQPTTRYFYQNKHLESYAAKEAKRITLRQLVFFGRSINEGRLIQSANYVRTELPVRIAHRLRDLQSLPYVVVTQEGVATVYELYWSAFEAFRHYPPITTLADNQEFCRFLSSMLAEHAVVIPSLSLGLSLSSPYLPPDQLDAFMRRMLVSRISRRVLAEHHIALSEQFTGFQTDTREEPHVGIIFTGLNVKRSVERCVRLLKASPGALEGAVQEIKWPEVVVEGHLDTTFPYIKEHLEYIVFELLKNSIHATAFKHGDSSLPLPPIQATIAEGENDVSIRISDQGGGLSIPSSIVQKPSDLFSFSHVRNATRMEDARLVALRSFSSSRHGIKATVGEQVERWQDDTRTERAINDKPGNEPDAGLHPRIGIGLPMSNIYATYFGGSLNLVSLSGWGTDVYVRLPKLGTNLEGIEV